MLLALANCSLGDGACLRMSDCESPYVCVEGTCRSDETNDSRSSSEGDLPSTGSSDAAATD